MKKAIVMKIEKDYAIVLSNQQFHKVQIKGHLSVGDQIFVSDKDMVSDKVSPLGNKRKYRNIVAIAAVLLLVFAGSMMMQPVNYEASVVVDINPSVMLNLNSDNIVVNYKTLNEDAEKLDLSNLDGLTIGKAIELIAEQATLSGFVDTEDLEDDYVLITSSSLKQQEAVEEEVEKLKETSQVMQNVNVAITYTSKVVMDEAIEENKVVGLEAIARQTGSDVSASVRENFDDPSSSESFESIGVVLEEDLEHEAQRVSQHLNAVGLMEEEKEAIMNTFVDVKESFFLAKDAYCDAQSHYESLLESGTDQEIQEAFDAMLAAEAVKDEYEQLKDDAEQVKDLLLEGLDNDKDKVEEELKKVFDDLEKEKEQREEEQDKREEEQEQRKEEQEKQNEDLEKEKEKLEEEQEQGKEEQEQERESNGPNNENGQSDEDEEDDD